MFRGFGTLFDDRAVQAYGRIMSFIYIADISAQTICVAWPRISPVYVAIDITSVSVNRNMRMVKFNRESMLRNARNGFTATVSFDVLDWKY